MFNFEKLEVWQKVRVLVNDVYKTTKSFPVDERFGLTMHLRKTVVSIQSNISEGCSRRSKKDFQRFIEIALGSTYEFVSQIFVAKDSDLLSEEYFLKWYNKSSSISQMLSALSKSLDKR